MNFMLLTKVEDLDFQQPALRTSGITGRGAGFVDYGLHGRCYGSALCKVRPFCRQKCWYNVACRLSSHPSRTEASKHFYV